MYTCSFCSNTYAWPQSLQRHIKNKHNAKDDEIVSYKKDITSQKSIFSDNITPDKEHMDLDESEMNLPKVNLEMVTIQQRVNLEMMKIQQRMFGMI